MAKKVYSWKEQLAIGEEGEQSFQALWKTNFHSSLIKAPVRDYD
jgi:hypothetical protein